MAVQITFEDAEIDAFLRLISDAGGDTAELMQDIEAAMVFSVQRRFETETGPDGKAWAPLSPRTASKRIGRRRRRGFENKLRVSGRLYSSITGDSSAAHAAVGTNLVYAATHQEGATIDMPERESRIRLRKVKGRTRFASRKHKRARDVDVTIGAHQITITARPYLGFSKEDRETILEIAEDFYRAQLEEAAK